MRTTRMTATLAAVCTLIATAVMAGTLAGGYDLSWRSIDSGGGTSVGGIYTLRASMGQTDAGRMVGGIYKLDGGFRAVGLASAGDCPGDVDGTGDVGIDDLLDLLAAWGACGGCPEDLDGDGMVGIDDLLDLLAAWGACP